MNPGCRVTGLFLVLLAVMLALPVAADAWQTRQWPHTASEWIRLALLPGALWLYLRYLLLIGCSRCGGDDER
jgi:hypothetical protein